VNFEQISFIKEESIADGITQAIPCIIRGSIMSDLILQTNLLEELAADQQQLLCGGYKDGEDYEYNDGHYNRDWKRGRRGLDRDRDDYLKIPIILTGAAFVPAST